MRILAALALSIALSAAQAQKPDASAEALRMEMVFWESVRNSTDPADFRAYLEQYPNGRFAPLARNRLSALGPKPAAAPAAAPVAPAASQAAASATGSRLPREGDSWTYKVTERRTGESGQYVARVVSASSAAIVERYSMGSASGEWTHKGVREIVPIGKSVFAPYFGVFSDLALHARLGRVDVVDCGLAFDCQASAWVAARENVQTPAGTFEAVRVEIDHNWRPRTLAGPTGAQVSGSRKITVWYSPAAKRAVKISSRPDRGVTSSNEIDFDLELVSYKLQ